MTEVQRGADAQLVALVALDNGGFQLAAAGDDVQQSRLLSLNYRGGVFFEISEQLGIQVPVPMGYLLPSAALDAQLYAALCAMDLGELDNSGVISVIETLNNEDLRIDK